MRRFFFLFIVIANFCFASPEEYILAAENYAKELTHVSENAAIDVRTSRYIKIRAEQVGRSSLFTDALLKHSKKVPKQTETYRTSTLESVKIARESMESIRELKLPSNIRSEGSKFIEAERRLMNAIKAFQAQLEQGRYP